MTTLILCETFWWTPPLPEATSSSVARVAFVSPSRIRQSKKPWYRADSFWALPPRDVNSDTGHVRSDTLDDFLYGA